MDDAAQSSRSESGTPCDPLVAGAAIAPAVGEAAATGPDGEMPNDASISPVASRSTLSIVLQLAGFVLGLGMLGLCVWLVARDEQKRTQAMELLHAPADKLAMVLALSGLSIALSGLVFWAVILPVRRVSAMDQIAMNGVSSALSYVPMKANLMFRVFYHRRMDGIGVLEITAWLGATAVMIALSLGWPVAASLVLGQVDEYWWGLTLGGMVLTLMLLPPIAAYCASDAGHALVERVAGLTRIGALVRMVRSNWFKKLYGATRMLASRRAMAIVLVLRLADVVAQAARFWVVSRVIHLDMSPGQCVLAGAMYFILQFASPTGVGGVQVGGLAVMLGAKFLPVVLAVTAADAVMNLVMGAVGAAWLRVDRLLVKGGSEATGKAQSGNTAKPR